MTAQQGGGGYAMKTNQQRSKPEKLQINLTGLSGQRQRSGGGSCYIGISFEYIQWDGGYDFHRRAFQVFTEHITKAEEHTEANVLVFCEV